MKIRITLSNSGGPIAGDEIELRDGTPDQIVSNAIQDTILPWTLSPGDTIQIEEI